MNDSPLRGASQEAVAALEREWPDWQIWVVDRYIGGPVWCARRWDDHQRVLNADSPQHLREYLKAAQ